MKIQLYNDWDLISIHFEGLTDNESSVDQVHVLSRCLKISEISNIDGFMPDW